MASGIYRLTFSSGKYYVGKSLDLETRWKQHFNKFATGKAARPMQIEYDRCGLPQTEVIFECHRDHIDILEELLIDQLKTPDMLNTTYPEVDRTDRVAILINNSKDLLQVSTLEHLEMLHSNQGEVDKAAALVAAAEAKVEEYRNNGYIITEDYVDLVEIATESVQEVEFLEEYCEELSHKLEAAQEQLTKLAGRNWWQRLWDHSV